MTFKVGEKLRVIGGPKLIVRQPFVITVTKVFAEGVKGKSYSGIQKLYFYVKNHT